MELGALIFTVVIVGLLKALVLFICIRLLYHLFGAVYRERPRRLWYLLPRDNMPETRIIWWSLAAFFFSEAFCGVETWILLRSSRIFGALHSVSAAGGMGLFGWGIYLFLDKRAFHFAQAGCLARKLCHECPRTAGLACKMRLLVQLLAAILVIALLPLWMASTAPMVANASRFALPWASVNAWFAAWSNQSPHLRPLSVTFVISTSTQVIDYKIIPGLAAVLAITSLWLLRKNREHQALPMLAFAAGLLSFSYLQLVMYRGTGDALIGSLGHELTEFWFLLFVAEFLRRAFGQNATQDAANV